MNTHSSANLRELVLSLAAIVRVQNGNQHDDINKLLQRAYEATQAYPATAWTKEGFAEMPTATYPQIDKYMAKAREFIALSSKGHQEVAQMTASAVARYMAFEDGIRIP